MPDTTRIYYIDTWFLSQNLPYYQPETLTSFTGSRNWKVETALEFWPVSCTFFQKPAGRHLGQFLKIYRNWVRNWLAAFLGFFYDFSMISMIFL